MKHAMGMGDQWDADVKRAAPPIGGQLRMGDNWVVECRDQWGQLVWVDTIHNLIVDEGATYAGQAVLGLGAGSTDLYIGLCSSSPATSSGHTLSSHVGWTEVEDYEEAIRQLYQGSTVSSSGGSNNSGNKASFEMSTDVAVGGAFLCTTSSGNGGTLYAVGAFTGGDKDLSSGDTLEVTATFNFADDGA